MCATSPALALAADVWGFEETQIDNCLGVGTANIAYTEMRNVTWFRAATVVNTSALSTEEDQYSVCGNCTAPERAIVDGVQALMIETGTECPTRRRLLTGICQSSIGAMASNAIKLRSFYATPLVQVRCSMSQGLLHMALSWINVHSNRQPTRPVRRLASTLPQLAAPCC